jgi:hypothetical protein
METERRVSERRVRELRMRIWRQRAEETERAGFRVYARAQRRRKRVCSLSYGDRESRRASAA